MKRARGWTAIETIMVLAVLGILALVGVGVLYEWRHPCTRHEIQTCYRDVCDWQMPIFDGDGAVTGFTCMSSHREAYQCRVCVERGGEMNEP